MLAKLFDLLWPRDCAVCGRPADRPGRHLCSDCVNRLPFIPVNGCCRRCGRDVAALDGEFLCDDCRRYRPAFDRVASAMRFEGEARELINAFKFRGAFRLRDDLVDVLEAVTTARFKVGEIDLIAPMPSTWLHRLDRGFNQVDYLAAALARRLRRPYVKRLLKRVHAPERQGRLSEEARRKNVVGTFAVRRPGRAQNRTVLVIDDIMTTGSTLSECAKELKAAGASRVWCATLARTFRA